MKNTYKKFYRTQVSGLFKGTALVAILRNWQITVYKYHTGPQDTHNKNQLTHFTEKNKHKPPSSEQPEAYLTSLYHPVRTLGGKKVDQTLSTFSTTITPATSSKISHITHCSPSWYTCRSRDWSLNAGHTSRSSQDGHSCSGNAFNFLLHTIKFAASLMKLWWSHVF